MPSKRLPAYKRQPNDARTQMNPTERDIQAWLAMYRYGGFMTVSQFYRWFYPNNERNGRKRISKMFHQGYINRLAPSERYLVPEPIIWLDERGKQAIAVNLGCEVSELELPAQPKFFHVPHDILLNEVLFAIDGSLGRNNLMSIRWMNQHQLNKAFSQKVLFLDSRGNTSEKRVIPDYYLNLSLGAGDYHFLIELDRDSEHTKRVVDEKILANLHLLLSSQYADVMGVSAGRILIVSSASPERLANIRALATQSGASRYCLFAQYAELIDSDPLTDIIWQLPHSEARVSLIDYVTPEFTQWLKNDVDQSGLPELALYRP